MSEPPDLFETDVDEPPKWYHINRTYLPLKGFYFFTMAAVGCLLPFIPIYMHQRGFHASEVGVIYGAVPFIGFLIRPFLGAIADKFRKHKVILIISILMWGLSFELLLLIPGREIIKSTNIQTNIHCAKKSFVRDCLPTSVPIDGPKCPISLWEFKNLSSFPANTTNQKPISCTLDCTFAIPGSYTARVCFNSMSRVINERCVDVRISLLSDEKLSLSLLNVLDLLDKRQGTMTYFTDICNDYSLENISYAGVNYENLVCKEETVLNCRMTCNVPVDNRCINHSSTHGISYWMFILLLLIGYTMFSPILSLGDAISYDVLGKKRNQWGKQRVFGTFGFASLAVSSTFIMDSLKQTDYGIDYSISFHIFSGLCIMTAIASYTLHFSEELICTQFFKNVKRLLSSAEIIAFLLCCTCLGILAAPIETFLYWYLQEHLNSQQLVFGLCIVTQCVAETPMLILSGKLMKRFGQLPSLYMGFTAYILRFVLYSVITNPWAVLPVELLHGFTFGLSFAALTSYGNNIAPKGMSATVQGIVSGLHFGFGKGIGSFISGFLVDSVGPQWMFRICALFSFVAMCLYLLANCFCLNHEDKQATFTDKNYESEDENREPAYESLLTSSDVNPQELNSPEHKCNGVSPDRTDSSTLNSPEHCKSSTDQLDKGHLEIDEINMEELNKDTTQIIVAS